LQTLESKSFLQDAALYNEYSLTLLFYNYLRLNLLKNLLKLFDDKEYGLFLNQKALEQLILSMIDFYWYDELQLTNHQLFQFFLFFLILLNQQDVILRKLFFQLIQHEILTQYK
jgi:hypothetical protein